MRMDQMESERAGWMTDGSSRMRNGVPVDEERIWRKADEPSGGDGGDARDRESARWRL